MQRSEIAKKILAVSFLAVFLFILSPQVGWAQSTDQFGLQSAAGIGLAQADLRVTIVNIIRVILGFLGILAVALIMYGGFIWLTSGGDEGKIDKARKILTNAIIGTVIILASFIIASFALNLLNGVGGGGGGGNGGGPGGRNDFGRWGIGVGPIDSVYPAPGQFGVPINTRVAVTFKELINPTTICGSDPCNGAMTNVEICELTAENVCVDVSAEFGQGAFAGSTITSDDNKTFVITSRKYLGLKDLRNRKFMVTLRAGIETQAEPGRSVFDSLIDDQYDWAFTTNGDLDLDPPEIMNLTGVYPYPDDAADTYSAGDVPTPTTFQWPSSLTGIDAQVAAGNTQPVIVAPGTITASISGTYTGTASGVVTVSIDDSMGVVSVDWPGGMTDFTSSSAYDGGSVINIGPYGLTFTLDGAATRSDGWTFNVTAFAVGDKIKVTSAGSEMKTYIYGRDMVATVNGFRDALIVDYPDIFSSCGDACVKTRATGAATGRYNIEFIDNGDGDSLGIVKTTGASATSERTRVGRFDAFRNTAIQINFNEAINPAYLNNITVKYDGDNNGSFESSVTNFQAVISNQYKTVELTGTEVCGVNSCGEEIYCWPMAGGGSTRYEVEVAAASLKPQVDNVEICSNWSGVLATDGSGRCQKSGVSYFYPQAIDNPDGIVDMSFNSFNGSFNSLVEGDRNIGQAEGKSGTGTGYSGRPAYSLNADLVLDGDRITGYGTSNPVYGLTTGSGYGDNFKWSFYFSSEIDTQAPLIKEIFPTGNAEISNASEIVTFKFDRLMRSSTLKPGWNYGSADKDRSLRYIVLDTISAAANPVGYWVSRLDIDNNGDGLADYNQVDVSHSRLDPFVQYGPLSGSGVQSITQNCFLPGGGPRGAADAEVTGSSNNCRYDSSGVATAGCVRDADLGAGGQVRLPNPASYGNLDCAQIKDAKVCTAEQDCKVLYYDAAVAATNLQGSWIITNDHPANSITDPTSADYGRTGCCLGKCVDR